MQDYAGVIDVTANGSVELPPFENYSVENPTQSLQAAERMWSIGEPSRSGERVTPDRALSIGAVWQAVTLISSDLAKLPIFLYRRKANDDRENMRNDPRSILVRKYPNPRLTPYKAWSRTYAQLLLYGNAYIMIERDRFDMPVRLWPMPSWGTRKVVVDGMVFYVAQLMEKDTPETIPERDVIHLERMCIDCDEGEYLVKHARDAFGLALARQGYMSDFYRAGGRLGGKLKIPAHFKKEARSQLVNGFRELYNRPGSAFLTYVAKDGVDYDESAFSLKDSETIEGSRASNRAVAQYFNLHPSKIGEESKSAYASKAEDNRDYLDTTLSPYTEQVEQELELKLFTTQELRDDQLYFEFNTDKLLRMNALDRANRYSVLRQSNIISPNEARRQENLPPYDGGDTYANPNTSTAAPEDVADVPDEPSTDATAATSEQIEAFRDLLANQLSVTLTAATAKIGRHGNPDNFATKRVTVVAAAVRDVMAAADRVLRAYSATTGDDFGTLSRTLEQALLDDLDNATKVDPEPDNFKTRLRDSVAEVSAARLVELIIPAELRR